MRIKEVQYLVHEMAKSKGFYDKPQNIGERLMLIVSELGEALEADRKSKYADLKAFNEDTEIIESEEIDSRDFVPAFTEHIKDTFQDEMADTAIRLFDLCQYLDIDLEKHIELKMKYNNTRTRLHGKAY